MWYFLGGPGGSGVNIVQAYGEAFQTIVDTRSENPSEGRYFDFVSWDPRGINNTIPASPGINDPAVLGQFNDRLVDYGYSLDDAQAFGEIFAFYRLYGQLISAPENGNLPQGDHIGRYVGTTYVARDMVEIVERYGEWRENEAKTLLKADCGSDDTCVQQIDQGISDNATVRSTLQATAWQKGSEKVQYWGISYGTIIGQTLASMYPERVGRFVLDGVVNATDYYSGTWNAPFTSDEDINANFTASCAEAGPSICPMANWISNLSYSDSDPATTLLSELESHLNALKENPVTGLFDQAQDPTFVTWSDALGSLFTMYYNGWAGYRIASRWLYELSQGNATWFHLTTAPPFACPVPPAPPIRDYLGGGVAVYCTDFEDKTAFTKEDWMVFADGLKNITPTFYGYAATVPMPCVGYQQRAKWRYTEPIGASAERLGNPILFVSQTLDPVCPLAGAEDAARLFEGSGVVEAQGVGHTSLGWPNVCALGAIRRYFATGEVSKERVLCPASVNAYETEAQAQSRLNDTQLSAAERELLSAALDIGSTWPELNTGGY